MFDYSLNAFYATHASTRSPCGPVGRAQAVLSVRPGGRAAPAVEMAWECGAVHVMALQCSVKGEATPI